MNLVEEGGGKQHFLMQTSKKYANFPRKQKISIKKI
jgi:hypothetical protein